MLCFYAVFLKLCRVHIILRRIHRKTGSPNSKSNLWAKPKAEHGSGWTEEAQNRLSEKDK